ncbi:hypothetical protein [Nocardia sp. R6R-6]|uniref:hypothetical protein n=1 Tax=Nocardia sp. R6R-6 TaxID=3459303 RepID=UPI00403D5F7A
MSTTGNGVTGIALVDLAHDSGSQVARTVRGRSCTDPRIGITADLSTRRVENDGTFSTIGPVYLVSLLVAVNPASSDAQSAASPGLIPYVEATAWRNILLPKPSWCYLREAPDGTAAEGARQWFFVFFIASNGELLAAPTDFDWVAHRVRYRGLLVSLIDRDGNRVETIYENERFPKFYQAYTEGRGRYWDIEIGTPPPDAKIADCFESLAKAVARVGAIADSIRPEALTWKHGTTVELVLRNDPEKRSYKISLTVPTADELDSGSHILRATTDGLDTVLTSPHQYANGVIARLREAGTSGIAAIAD